MTPVFRFFLLTLGAIDAEVNASKGEGQQDKLALSSFSVDVVQLVWQATAEIVKKLDKDLEAFGLRLDMTGEGFTHFFRWSIPGPWCQRDQKCGI